MAASLRSVSGTRYRFQPHLPGPKGDKGDRGNDTIFMADRGVLPGLGIDIGPKMQETFDSLSVGGLTRIVLPTGDLVWNTATTCQRLVSIEGQGTSENGTPQGTRIRHTDPTTTPLTIVSIAGAGPTANGGCFKNCTIMQAQANAPAPVWTPTLYQPFMKVQTPGFALKNLLGYGVDKLCQAVGAGRLEIKGLKGEFFSYAVDIDLSFDADRIVDVHAFPYWSVVTAAGILANENGVRTYGQANASVFRVRRQDTPFYDRIFALGYKEIIGLYPGQTTGGATKVTIGGIHGDAVKHVLANHGVEGIQVDVRSLVGQHISAVTGGATGVPAAPITGARTILTEGGGSNIISIGWLQSEFADGKVVENTTTTIGSIYKVGDGLVRNIVGGAGTAVFALASATSPHEVSIASDLKVAATGAAVPLLSTGSNAIVRAPSRPYSAVTPDVAWAFDGTGNAVPLTQGGTLSLAPGSGKIYVNENTTGLVGEFTIGGGGVTLDKASTVFVVSGTPPAGKIGLFFNPTPAGGGPAAYQFVSNYGSANSLTVVGIRLRASV